MNNLKDDPQLQKVVEKGIRLLAYSSNTEKQLRNKLKKSGFDAANVEKAVEYFKEKGYIDDEQYMIRAIENFSQKKLYGQTRIQRELYKMGFSAELIRGASYDEIDFIENCRRQIEKRGGGELNEKLIASMRRYGYTTSQIKEAYAQLETEE